MQTIKSASWGGYPYTQQKVLAPSWINPSSVLALDNYLPYGCGRSYGDSCLNSAGTLLSTQNHKHFLLFDTEKGILRCQSGVTFEEIICLVLPKGWFLPVTPGTKYLTVGGAVANDVHGKNHHVMGSFGHHITKMQIIRSQEGSLEISPHQHAELFYATIGGLGLTGLIDWVEFTLLPTPSAYLDAEIIPFKNLDEFIEIESLSQNHFDYIVSWVDAQAQGAELGRGLYIRGNWSTRPQIRFHRQKLTIPFYFPSFCINPLTVKTFNWLYRHQTMGVPQQKTTHYDSFFYPLDSVSHWNRIYGKAGFVQYQFVIPLKSGIEVLKQILKKIADSGLGSPLTVLKSFGAKPSLGLMSFAQEGYTYAMDFKVESGVFTLLEELDLIICEAGGRLYPAKDARMSTSVFQKSYPQWEQFLNFKDPAIQSDFFRRVIQPGS